MLPTTTARHRGTPKLEDRHRAAALRHDQILQCGVLGLWHKARAAQLLDFRQLWRPLDEYAATRYPLPNPYFEVVGRTRCVPILREGALFSCDAHAVALSQWWRSWQWRW